MNPLPTEFPVLHTGRLTLSAVSPANLPDLYREFSDPSVTRYYNLQHFTNTEKAAELLRYFTRQFEEKEGIRWGIYLKKDNSFTGTIGINTFMPGDRCNIGFDLIPQYWNKGYMSEALEIISLYIFASLEVNRIEAEVMPENEGACRVLEKTGFIKEGLLRDWMYFNEKYYDMYMYALLKKDFNKV
jgi:ribosomal-protein-alanine N-acetyltransferase